MNYKIYCDGAVSGNGTENSIGGFGYIILNDTENIIVERSKGFLNTTNQQMELKAAIESLSLLNSILKDNDNVKIFSDSAYLINCKNNKWYNNWELNGWKNAKKQPVANKELWIELLPYFKSTQFDFIKVKGHENNKWNNYVDNLAVEARLKLKEMN